MVTDAPVSVTVPGLNGGQAIEKTGLTIEARDMELDWYRGVSSDTPALDLTFFSVSAANCGSISTGSCHHRAGLNESAAGTRAPGLWKSLAAR